MTITDNTMEWLNQNRYRAYPMRFEEWREKASPESGLDAVLLDVQLFDNRAAGLGDLRLISVDITHERTQVAMEYANSTINLPALTGGEVSGPGSYISLRASIASPTAPDCKISLSLVLSSHAYLLDRIGVGHWDIGCRALPSRVVSMTDGAGVDGIITNGSLGVSGHEEAAAVSGAVVLEDGYRTSPIIRNGRVVVRVGARQGKNPCHYKRQSGEAIDCREPLMFFCGQNAINSGDVQIRGGKGINIEQGRLYTIKTGALAGRTIPCVEIVAGDELLDTYQPVNVDSSANNG